MPNTIGGQLALALAAGTLATKADVVAPSIRDRRDALKRAIARTSTKIPLGDVEDDPASDAHRAALASALEEHGATRDRDVLTTAKELLALIKMDEAARGIVATMIDDVEAALIALSAVDVESAEAHEAAASRPDVVQREVSPPATTSRRLIPAAEHSKTELERLALPIWQRTERFFTKLLILCGFIAAGAIAWFVLSPSPNEALDGCRSGDKARCWQVVTAADAVDQGRHMPEEPLQLLCDRHKDPCACAGLAYVVATRTEGTVDCAALQAASTLDPRWPCTCRRYDFWRSGLQRTLDCGIPRCE